MARHLLSALFILLPVAAKAQYEDFNNSPGFEVSVQYNDADLDADNWNQTPPPLVDAAPNVAMSPPPQAPTMNDFVQALSPYGTWLVLPQLGRVWRPSPAVVGANFVPYVSHGSWARVGGQWGFQSRLAWGWAPFHFGRWHQSPQYGWVWWPDSQWAPAWVDWRHQGQTVAWAPRPPPGYSMRFGPRSPGWCATSLQHFRAPTLAQHVWYPQHQHQARWNSRVQPPPPTPPGRNWGGPQWNRGGRNGDGWNGGGRGGHHGGRHHRHW